MKVLYVEDDARDADLARREFARLGAHFGLEFASGLGEARERLGEGTAHDLVLTDLKLPDGSGLELLLEIRARALPVAAVVLTGSGSGEAAVAAFKAGADDFVLKTNGYLARLPGVLTAALGRFRAEGAREESPLRVLYAEDSAIDADLTRRHLARHAPNIRLEVVQGVPELLQRLPRTAGEPSPCDVLLLDYRLAGADALEALRMLREERHLYLPVVLVTGQGDGEVAARAFRCGASNYVIKRPGYLSELPAVLESAYDRAQLVRNIAERKLTEEGLRQSEQRYRELVNAVPGAVYSFRIDAQGRRSFPFVSEGVGGLAGLSPGAVVADAEVAFQRVPAAATPALEQSIGASLQQLSPWMHEFPIRTSSGEEKWLRGQSLPRLEAGGATVWHGVFIDITTRKRAEEALRTSEENLRAVAENATAGITIFQDGRRVFANRRAAEMLGYTVEEYLPLALGDVIHPDSLALVLDRHRRRAAGEDVPSRYEFTALAKDGRAIPVEGNYAVTVWNDRPAIMAFVTDITERKNARRMLQESEQKYRRIYESLQDVYLETSLDGTIRDISPQIEVLTRGQYKRGEFIGRSATEFYADAGRHADFTRALKEQGRVADFEISFLNRDGSEIPCSVSATVLRDADGRTNGIVSTLRDISERKRAEKKLRKRDAHLRLLTENIPAGVAYADRDFVIQVANQCYVELHCGAGVEVVGRHVRDVVGEKAWPEVAKQSARVLAGEPVVYERTHERPDGERREIEVHLEPDRPAGGEARGYYAFVLDITERKRAQQALRESEERFRATFEQAAVGVAHVGIDGRWLSVNQRLCDIAGYTRDELLARSFQDITHPEDLDADLGYLRRTLAGEISTYSMEKRYVRKDGELVWINLTVALVRKDSGEPDYLISVIEDISVRKQAEEALRESEARFRDLSDLSSDWYWEQDENCRFVDVKDVSARLSPLRATNYVGYTRWEAYAECLAPEQWAAHRRQVEAHEPFRDLEYPRLSQDGHMRWVSTSGRPIFDREGRFKGYRGIGKEITERKTTENALRLLSTGMAHLSGEAFFNEVAGRVAEYLEAEIGFVNRLQAPANTRIRTLGLCIDRQVMPPLEFDLADTPCEAVIGKQPVVLPEQVRQLFPGFRMAADLCVSGYAAVPLFDTHGKPIGAVGVMSRAPLRQPAERIEALLRLFAVRTAAEIERLGAEARFKDLFEFSADACVIVNQMGIITAMNQGARSLFDYSREELVGLPVDILVPEHSRKGHAGMRRNSLAATASRPMGTGRTDLYARRKDGTTFPADIDLHRLQTDDGVMVVATVRDMTAHRQDEERRRTLELQLRQSQKMEAIGTLAGGIAHDFNNIIGAILGNAELARQDVGADHLALESITEIGKAGRRARDLVQQILAFSRKQTFSRSVVALGPVVEEAVKLLRATLPASVQLGVSCAAGLPNVSADPTQIHQVLVNLCTNAWHAMEGRPGYIEIHLEEVTVDTALAQEHPGPRRGRCVRLSVRDSGKGMDAATKERIFEPFFTTKVIGEGTGLGLSVVHGIMEGHEGAIVVDSTPGKGTTFQLYFPAVDAPAAAQPAVAEVPALPQGRLQHVLYLDDDEALVSLVGRMLHRQGYRVSGHTVAQKALDAVRADPGGFDLVVTDYNMPGMSGLDVARELSRIRPDLPVAVTSGYITDELREKAPQSGVRHLIYKPDTADELCDMVRRLTNQAG